MSFDNFCAAFKSSTTIFAMRRIAYRQCAVAAAVVAVALVAGCATAERVPLQEKFGSGGMHSRLFDAPPAQTCEAGRLALLSQGYLVDGTREDLVEGSKSFQPSADSHVQMTIRVVCVADAGNSGITLGFVTGLQDSYTVKKSNNSASLGVPALGSLSLPFSASSESLVKVGSQTVTSVAFYDSFFDILQRYLVERDPGAQAGHELPPAPLPGALLLNND